MLNILILTYSWPSVVSRSVYPADTALGSLDRPMSARYVYYIAQIRWGRCEYTHWAWWCCGSVPPSRSRRKDRASTRGSLPSGSDTLGDLEMDMSWKHSKAEMKRNWTNPGYRRTWGVHPSTVHGRLTAHCTPVDVGFAGLVGGWWLNGQGKNSH